jgi:hypothetical protein
VQVDDCGLINFLKVIYFLLTSLLSEALEGREVHISRSLGVLVDAFSSEITTRIELSIKTWRGWFRISIHILASLVE